VGEKKSGGRSLARRPGRGAGYFVVAVEGETVPSVDDGVALLLMSGLVDVDVAEPLVTASSRSFRRLCPGFVSFL